MKTRIWILIGMLMGVIVSCSEDSISPSTDPETFGCIVYLKEIMIMMLVSWSCQINTTLEFIINSLIKIIIGE